MLVWPMAIAITDQDEMYWMLNFVENPEKIK